MSDPQDCRIVEVDGEPVRVQASGDWSEADHAAFAEIVRALKAKIANAWPKSEWGSHRTSITSAQQRHGVLTKRAHVIACPSIVTTFS